MSNQPPWLVTPSREKRESMNNQATDKPVLVIPCSGIGKVHGLISREATYLVTDEIAPGQTKTLCLALLVKRDAEAVAAIQNQHCITIDGCPKACAEKNVQMAGGCAAKAVQVTEAFKKHPGAKPGTATDLTDDGWAIARDVAKTVADEAARLHTRKEAL
jgi:uncharacterized metal-binding protein